MTDDRAALARPLDLDAYAYVSPKLEKRARPEGGFGLFTVAPISRDETLTVMGGVIASRAQLERLPRRYAGRTIQVEEDLYQISIRSDETADFVNHSCQPNAGIRGQVVMIAMRDIPVGEEITYDYAMSDGSSFDVFACNCGAPACRRRVTGDDWRNTNLWDLYDGYFSDYLARRIATLREADKAREREDMKMGEGIYRNLHRGLRVQETGDARGRGLFAIELIEAGTLLWKEQAADVRQVRFSELDELDPEQRETLLHYAWQTGEDVLEGPISADEAHADASFAWNHSCDPSAWLVTDDEIVARKDISPGDEITCDYATWIASPVLFEAQFPSRCLCGSGLCREYLSANDWRRPELQKRYGPHFLSFVLRRIVAERSGHDAS